MTTPTLGATAPPPYSAIKGLQPSHVQYRRTPGGPSVQSPVVCTPGAPRTPQIQEVYTFEVINWHDRMAWGALGFSAASAIALAAAAALAVRQLQKSDDFIIQPWPPTPLPMPIDGGPVEILPYPKPALPFEISGRRFQHTQQLRLNNKGHLWNPNDVTVLGTKGNDALRVDQHWVENGNSFFRREDGQLRILDGDPGGIVAGWGLDDVVTQVGKDLWRHKRTGKEFKAVFTAGSQKPIRQ